MSQHLFPKSHRSLSMNQQGIDNGQSRFNKNETISYSNLHQTGNQSLLYEGGQKDDSNEQIKESNNQNDDNNTFLSAHSTPNKIPINSPNKNVVVTSESKKVNGMNFQVVSMQPSKKQQVDKNLIKHFKQIQDNDYNNWNQLQGGTGNIMNTKFIQRPGLGDQQQNIEQVKDTAASIYVDENGVAPLQNLNSRKLSNSGQQNGKNQFVEEQKQYLKNEEKRFRCMLDLMLKFRDWEEEKIKMQLMQGSGNQTNLNENNQTDGQNQGSEEAVPNMEHYAFQSAQTQLQYIQNNLKSEFVNFKPLKDSSILVHNGQSTIYFQKGAILNSYMNMNESSVDMYFKLVKCEAKLLRSVLENNGFQQTETHDWNVLWSSQSYKQYVYDNLNEYQKINHFPNSFELTRKDRLCVNVVKLQEKFGKEAFDIIPDTYNLPDEFADFYSHFHQLRQQQDHKRSSNQGASVENLENFNQWIIKPTNSSQGRGIFIIDDISEVPIDEPCIVSRYVPNPLLINGLKFDVRIYVLVTSMDPWRIYVYHEGLARFASEEYDPKNIKSNKFAHLTNYSINKKSEKFVQNQSADQSDEGHKWSLGALSKCLEQMGVDMDILWSKIYDVILKSFIAVDGQIQSHLRKINSSNNCFELLGFDVLIDSDLKPWLMEVNLSPSLACDSPIDLKIKHGLFVDAMNLVCMRKFDRRRENLNKMKQRAKNIVRAKSYQNRTELKQPSQKTDSKIHISKALNAQGCYQLSINNKAVLDKVQNVQPKYRDILRETLQEHFRKGGFLRIYPSKTSNVYDKYFQQSPKTISQEMNTMGGQNGFHHSRISNKQLYKMLYTDDLVPYQSHAVMKNYNRTFSRFQKMPVQNSEAESSENTPTILKGNNSSSNDLSHNLIQKSGRIADSSFSQNRKILNSENKKSFQKLNKLHAIHNQNPMNNLTHSPQKQFISKRSGFASEQTSSNNRFLPALGSANNNGPKKGEKLLITGDDILIEYVARLMIAVRSMKENMLKAQWVYQIEKFIKHSVWHSSDVRRKQNNKLWQRLESRLIEMKERRKRLLQSLYKKELKTLQEAHNVQPGMAQAGFSANRQAQQIELEQFQKEYKLREEQKNVIIQGFSAQQLEDMLHTSTKNVAYEVISCLISADKSSEKEKNLEPSSASKFSGQQQSTVSCKGVLTDIIKWLTMTNQQQTLQDVEFSILDQISTKQNRSNSKYDIYGMQGSNQKGGNVERRRRVPIGNRTKLGHNYGIGGQTYEDETESYQPHQQRSRLKNKSNNCLQQSFGQNDDTYILDGKSSTTRKLNPNAQARLRNVSNQNTLEGNDLLSSPAQVDYELDGFGNLPSPHRHLGSSSMKTKQNLVKLENDGAIIVGQNSTMLQGGSKNISGLSSLSGLTGLSGIKSLQSTAKKNRIIINDDLRTHHQQKQQKLNQQSQNPSSRESREMDTQGINFTVRNFDLDMNDNQGEPSFDQTKKSEHKQEKINNRDLILVSDLSASGRSKSGVSIHSRDSNVDDLDVISNVNKQQNQDYRHTEPEQQQIYENNLEDKDVLITPIQQENTFDNRRKLSKNVLAVTEPLLGTTSSTIPQSNKKSSMVQNSAQKQKTIVLNKNMINFSSQGQQENLASLNKKDNYQSVAAPNNSLIDGKQDSSAPTQIKPKKFMQTPKNLKAKIKNKQ